MTPLEAMARAIANADGSDYWAGAPEWRRDEWRRDASAALTALAENVSEGMIAKGAGYSDFGFVPGVIENVDDYKKEVSMIFRAMCAAAGGE